MNTPFINGRAWPVPHCWNLLSRAQLLRAVRVLFTPATEGQLHARLLCVLLELWRPRRTRLAWQMIRMPLLDIEECRQLTRFLIHEQARLTRQLLPSLRPAWWRRPWYGPGDRLNGLTFTEWIDAESALFRFRKTQDAQFLNRLVAVLYRPGRQAPDPTTGDRRRPYAQHQLDARAAQAGRLPAHVRQAVLLYYDGCRQFYIDAYPQLFGQGDEEEPGEGAKQPQNPGPAYLRILRELAGSPDKFDLMGRQPIGNIFYDLAERIQQAAELEAELKANRAT